MSDASLASARCFLRGPAQKKHRTDGLGVLRRGPPYLHVAAAMWLGLVSLALGLLNGAVFLHPIVLAVLPATVMRLVVVTAIGAGAGAAVLGSALFSEVVAGVGAADRVRS